MVNACCKNAYWNSIETSKNIQQCFECCQNEPVEAPNERDLSMCPTFDIPPSATTGTPNLRAYSATRYTAVDWGLPTAMTENRDDHSEFDIRMIMKVVQKAQLRLSIRLEWRLSMWLNEGCPYGSMKVVHMAQWRLSIWLEWRLSIWLNEGCPYDSMKVVLMAQWRLSIWLNEGCLTWLNKSYHWGSIMKVVHMTLWTLFKKFNQ